MIKDLKQTLLNYYNLSEEDYLDLIKEPSINLLPDPFLINDMKKAVDLVYEAKKNKEKIMVYGDYDVDGIMSTSIMVKTLRDLDIECGYYIPSRYIDKYGINLTKVKEIYEKGYKLIITVDNGICALDALNEAHNLGMKVIILDHHEYGDTFPYYDALIHHDFSNLPKIKTSAGFLSFLFSKAILNKFDPYLFILGSISIVSDMMPLKSFNRDALRLAIKIYPEYKPNAIELLSNNADFNELTIGMTIAPKINAVGRMIKGTNINRLVTYFVTEDSALRTSIFKWIESIAILKRDTMNDVLKTLPNFDNETTAICEIVPCLEGLVGLIANRYLNQYFVPTVIFTHDEENPSILRGSMRSKEGFNIMDFYKQNEDILLEHGGHEKAGGVSILETNYDNFKKKLIDYSKIHKIIDKIPDAIEFEKEDISFKNYEIIESFSPFGEEFKAPNFVIKNVDTESLTFIKNDSMILTKIDFQRSVIGFGISKNSLKEKNKCDLYGTLSINTFKNIRNLQFNIDKIL